MNPSNNPKALVPKQDKFVQKIISRNFIGYLIAAAGLVWVFYDIQPAKLIESLATINWWWIGIAVLFDILSYVCQGFRWEYLIRPISKLSPWQTTQAVYAGLFINEIVPMRFGELVRAYLISRWMRVDFIRIVPSMIVERILDGIWLAISIGLTALFIQLPEDLVEAGDALGILVLVMTGLFVYIIFRGSRGSGQIHKDRPGQWKLILKVRHFFSRVEAGLQQIGFSRNLFIASWISLLVLAFQAIAFWLVMKGYGFTTSFWVGAVVFLIVHLGTALPNAPSNVGSFQFFCVVGLTIFGIEKTSAAGFSVVVFVILTIPLWIIGFFALAQTGSTLQSLRADLKEIMTIRGNGEGYGKRKE